MKDLREEVGTKTWVVGKIVKSRMKWAGHMVRMIDDIGHIAENIRDKEARRLQKARKTTAKMGGLSEERPKQGRGRRKLERNCQKQGPMETN